MGSAAQAFRYARLRRSQTAPQRGAEMRNDSEISHERTTGKQLGELTSTPRSSSAVQPLVVAGLAPSELATVTTVSGASSGPLRLEEHPPERGAPVHPPVFLERRARPRNGKSVRALNVTIAAMTLIILSPLMVLIA